MSMRASRAITKGQEIFNDYGERSRSDLLRRYGYITDSAKKWDITELDRTAVIQIAGDHQGLSEGERTERVRRVAREHFGQRNSDAICSSNRSTIGMIVRTTMSFIARRMARSLNSILCLCSWSILL